MGFFRQSTGAVRQPGRGSAQDVVVGAGVLGPSYCGGRSLECRPESGETGWDDRSALLFVPLDLPSGAVGVRVRSVRHGVSLGWSDAIEDDMPVFGQPPPECALGFVGRLGRLYWVRGFGDQVPVGFARRRLR